MTNSQRDGQAEIQTEKCAYEQTDRQVERMTDRQRDGQADIRTGIQTCRQTGRSSESQSARLTDKVKRV